MENNKLVEYLKNKEKQMEECEHLFLKIKEGRSYNGYHSSDYEYEPCVVVCLKCGLTNRFIGWRSPVYNGFFEVNDKVFKKQFDHAWKRNGKGFDDSVFNLISDEVWNVNHPTLLYNIAKNLKSEADNQELFDTMNELYEIQTPLERAELKSIEQAHELISRYKQMKVKVLKYEKK